MTLGIGIGAKDAEQPIREGTARRPRLLPVDDEPFTVAYGLGLDPREVTAGVGLGPALRPDLFTARHLRQEAILLFLRAELEQRRAEQRDAVGRDAKRSARGVILLFEDQPLDERTVTSAVHLGPRHHGPTTGEQMLLPFAVLLETIGRVEGLQPALGHVGLQPRARLVAKCFFSVGERQVHDGSLRSAEAVELFDRLRNDAVDEFLARRQIVDRAHALTGRQDTDYEMTVDDCGLG